MSYHFFAMLSRMKHINRWGLMRNTVDENLSEHSLEVAFIAHAICTISNKRLGTNLNADRAAVLSMFHDTTEIITGDLPTPIKYNNQVITNAYKELEKTAGDALLHLLPPDLRDEYDGIYNNEDEELEKVVKAADKISALIKCIEEEHMGNDDFRTAAVSIRKKIDNLNMPAAKMFMDEFFDSFGMTLDELKANA